MFIHNLNPVALEFFGLKLYWYSLAYLLGFIFSVYYSKLIIRKGVIDLKTDIVDNFFSWAIIGVIFGGRLFFSILKNAGITDPLLAIPFPYLKPENLVLDLPIILFALMKSLSDTNVVAP